MDERMTLDRFKALAASFGGSLERWPAEEREAAAALLRSAPAARRLLGEAAALDRAIAPALGEAAALARLRAGVAQRIAASPRSAPLSWRARLRRALDRRMLGFATGGGLVLAAGLLIGWLQAVPPAAPGGGLLAMFEPSPLQLLAE